MPIPVFAPRRTTASNRIFAPSPASPRRPSIGGREAAALTLFAASVFAGSRSRASAAIHCDPTSQGGRLGRTGRGILRARHGRPPGSGRLGRPDRARAVRSSPAPAPRFDRQRRRLAGDVLVACIVSALLHIALPQATVVRRDADRRDVRRALRRGAAFALLDHRLVHHRPHRDRPHPHWPRVFLVHRLGRARRPRYRWPRQAKAQRRRAARWRELGPGARPGARALGEAAARGRAAHRLEWATIRRSLLRLSEDDSDGQDSTPPPLRIAETPDVADRADAEPEAGAASARDDGERDVEPDRDTNPSRDHDRDLDRDHDREVERGGHRSEACRRRPTTRARVRRTSTSTDAASAAECARARRPMDDGPTIVDTIRRDGDAQGEAGGPQRSAALLSGFRVTRHARAAAAHGARDRPASFCGATPSCSRRR